MRFIKWAVNILKNWDSKFDSLFQKRETAATKITDRYKSLFDECEGW